MHCYTIAMSLVSILFISPAWTGPVSVFVRPHPTKDQDMQEDQVSPLSLAQEISSSEEQDTSIAQDQVMMPKSKLLLIKMPSMEVAEDSRSVSNSFSQTCEPLPREDEDKCSCDRHHESDPSLDCKCSAKIKDCRTLNGTEVCLCCTAKQCISQGGIDSPSKDLSTIFGGKFLPGLLSKLIGGIKKMPLPQLPLPNRVSLPSFSLPTLPRIPHVSLPELPIPQISSFQNPIHYIFKLGPMPRSQPRASFQDILDKTGNKIFNLNFEDDIRNSFFDAKKSWMKSETHSRECFEIKATGVCSCSSGPSCSCSAETKHCDGDQCVCCVDKKCKIEI